MKVDESNADDTLLLDSKFFISVRILSSCCRLLMQWHKLMQISRRLRALKL